jgi:hypothetical protein
MKKYFATIIFFCLTQNTKAQGLLSKTDIQFTRQDSFKSSITKSSWWDVKYYNLDIKVNQRQHNRWFKHD